MLYITADDNLATCAQMFKSLQQFSHNYCEPDFLADLPEKGTYNRETHYLRVFKTKKAWLNGFDYTLYSWNGDKLRKATKQPCVALNKLFS